MCVCVCVCVCVRNIYQYAISPNNKQQTWLNAEIMLIAVEDASLGLIFLFLTLKAEN